jgi:3-hydroxyisobutyrate dehydrogenase-like beta-hydroxyacid dehydrogenase
MYAEKAGLDLTETINAVGAGAAGSFSINNLGPRMVRRRSHLDSDVHAPVWEDVGIKGRP